MRESAQSFGVDSRQRMNIRAGCSQKGRESRRGRGRRERLGDFSPRLTSSCSAFRLLERNKRPPQSVYETTRRDASRRANKRTNDRFYNFPLSLFSLRIYLYPSIYLRVFDDDPVHRSTVKRDSFLSPDVSLASGTRIPRQPCSQVFISFFQSFRVYLTSFLIHVYV